MKLEILYLKYKSCHTCALVYKSAVYQVCINLSSTTYSVHTLVRTCAQCCMCVRLTFSCQWLWQCTLLHTSMVAAWGWPQALSQLLFLGVAGNWLSPGAGWPRWLSQWCCCVWLYRVWQRLAPGGPKRQQRNWSSVITYHAEQWRSEEENRQAKTIYICNLR